MEFNDKWTKSDNDKLRQMYKDKKTYDQIVEEFGYGKLQFHPKKKFTHTRIPPFAQWVNEIKINPSYVYYDTFKQKSNIDNNVNDYMHKFEINGRKYILMLNFIIQNNIKSYNIFFTTGEQYDNYIKYVNTISTDILSLEDQQKLKDISEKETNFNELMPIMKSISYILFSFHNTIERYGNYPYSIEKTDNPQKINLYSNIVNNSFKNVEETIVNDIYYFKIND